MKSKLTNIEIADLLDQLCFYKQLAGANIFSVKAFANGARFIENFCGDPLTHEFTKETGIGDKVSGAIKEAASTGLMSELENLKSRLPNVHDMTKVAGIGPKRALKLYEAHGALTRQDLLTLLTNEVIKDKKLFEAVKFALVANDRMPRYMVEQRIAPLLDALRPLTLKMEVVGSMRRKKETIKDVDILVVTEDRVALMALFTSFGNILSQGPDKCSIQIDGGAVKFQTDLLCANQDSWGAALNYFTGSKEHNIVLRTLAKARGLTINEYGIFNGEVKIGGAEETDVYDTLGIPYVPPELREGSDVLHTVPKLVDRSDIVVDAHMHTEYSDGKDSVDTMVQAAIACGLKQIGISDHIANAIYGSKLMSEESVMAKWIADINLARSNYPQVSILMGAEVDISVNGDISFPSNLDDLDYVIASAHTVPHTNLTERFLKAITHSKVAILGHPTGKEFSKRGSGEADWSLIFSECAKANVAVEINGVPGRLDLPEHLVRLAIKNKCKLICTSDAHNSEMIAPDLNNALAVARRAGATKDNIITDLVGFINSRKLI